MKTLTKKPSKLIRIALDDLKACMEDERYLIDFDDWHIPIAGQFNDRKLCRVCFAGSVMAKSLGFRIDKPGHPKEFLGSERQLYALDQLRKGRIKIALKRLGMKHPEGLQKYIRINQGNYSAFVGDMENMINLLKSYKL